MHLPIVCLWYICLCEVGVLSAWGPVVHTCANTHARWMSLRNAHLWCMSMVHIHEIDVFETCACLWYIYANEGGMFEVCVYGEHTYVMQVSLKHLWHVGQVSEVLACLW